MRGGPNGMNLAVVLRTTWAVAQVLKERGLGGSQVVVGRDARHGSEEFALAAAEVLAAEGFMVTLMFAAVPTPVVAFGARHMRRQRGHPDHRVAQPARRTTATRCTSTAACRSISPTDREIEAADRQGAARRRDPPGRRSRPAAMDLIQRYIDARRARPAHTRIACGWR